jgi:beta-glucanase (GH16 family)
VLPRIRFSRRAAAVAVAVAATLTLAPTAAATAATSSGDSGSSAAAGTFHQVFAAYFTNPTVDRRYWAVYNNGSEAKAHLAANVVTQNGYVSLKTRYNSSLGKWTTAGMCLCNAPSLKRTYGEWEMRARVSAGDSRAVALLWPTVGWPPEVDFMEMGGESTQGTRQLNTMTVHYGSHAQNYMIHSSEKANFTIWHTIGVRWTPSSIQYMLDGKVTQTITAHVPHQQMWFGVQTAPERSSRPTKPVDFDIDWVKEYAYSG